MHVQVPEWGSGAVGAIFVHERHGRDASIPRLGGWWGIDADRRFDMDGAYTPAEGAAGWSLSTVPILSLAPIAASLAIFDSIGMPALRARSVELTGYLERLLADLPLDILTPRDPASRGAQLSIRLPAAEAVLAVLASHGVVADFRAPDIIRLAPVPLYNTFHDAWRAADVLREAIRPD